jgi:hypothetical protein
MTSKSKTTVPQQQQSTVMRTDADRRPVKRFIVVDDEGLEFQGGAEKPRRGKKRTGGEKIKKCKKSTTGNRSGDTADNDQPLSIRAGGVTSSETPSVSDKKQKKKKSKNRVLQMSESDSERSDAAAPAKAGKENRGARVTSVDHIDVEERLSLIIAMREDAEESAEFIASDSGEPGDDGDDPSSDTSLSGFVEAPATESDSNDSFEAESASESDEE